MKVKEYELIQLGFKPEDDKRCDWRFIDLVADIGLAVNIRYENLPVEIYTGESEGKLPNIHTIEQLKRFIKFFGPAEIPEKWEAWQYHPENEIPKWLKFKIYNSSGLVYVKDHTGDQIILETSDWVVKEPRLIMTDTVFQDYKKRRSLH